MEDGFAINNFLLFAKKLSNRNELEQEKEDEEYAKSAT